MIFGPEKWRGDMAELKCPHCGQAFTVDDTELGSIMKQIRDKEFEIFRAAFRSLKSIIKKNTSLSLLQRRMR